MEGSSTTSHGRLQLQVKSSGVYDELVVDAPTPWLYHQLQLVAKVVQTLILTEKLHESISIVL